jgi:hypothetical protein
MKAMSLQRSKASAHSSPSKTVEVGLQVALEVQRLVLAWDLDSNPMSSCKVANAIPGCELSVLFS